MSSDDKLRLVVHQFFHPNQQSELAGDRQSRFRFIEYKQAVPRQSILNKGQKTLTMRILMKHTAIIYHLKCTARNTIQFTGYIIKTLGSEKIAVFIPVSRSHQFKIIEQARMRIISVIIQIRTASFRIESGTNGKSFDKSRFSCPVFSGNKRNAFPELKLIHM